MRPVRSRRYKNARFLSLTVTAAAAAVIAAGREVLENPEIGALYLGGASGNASGGGPVMQQRSNAATQ